MSSPKVDIENETLAVDVSKSKSQVKRVFTVLKVTHENQEGDFKGGKFQSKTPAGAARKAANQACKAIYGNEDCTIEISIKETTKNGSSKEYPYEATRKLNEKDVQFTGQEGGGVKIPFKYSMTLKSLKKNSKGKVVEKVPVPADEMTVDEKV